jgi:hypothetical protein
VLHVNSKGPDDWETAWHVALPFLLLDAREHDYLNREVRRLRSVLTPEQAERVVTDTEEQQDTDHYDAN